MEDDPQTELHDEIERQHRAERAERFGRIRRLLRPLPRRTNLARYPVLRHFADAARKNPHLWSFQTDAVRRAIYVGAILAFLPIYGLQLFLGLGAAMLFRANLAIVCAFQLITNPLTAGPVYYVAYRIGSWLIQTLEFGHGREAMGTRFNALVLGGLVLGLTAAVIADLAHRFILWEAGQLKQRHAAARARAEAARADRGMSQAVPKLESSAAEALESSHEPEDRS